MNTKDLIDDIVREGKKLLEAYKIAVEALENIEHNSKGLESAIAKSALAKIDRITSDDTPSAKAP